jgi:hypothetical protein
VGRGFLIRLAMYEPQAVLLHSPWRLVLDQWVLFGLEPKDLGLGVSRQLGCPSIGSNATTGVGGAS